MLVTLIHPPVNDPRSPRLALPSLAAFLRKSGIPTRLIDLDLDSLIAILKPDSIDQAGKVVRARYKDTLSPSLSHSEQLAKRSESLVSKIQPALDTIRDPVHFYDPRELSAARDIVFDCVELIAAASKRSVHYRLDLLQYDVDGVDPTSFKDLVSVSNDQEANLFADYWEREFYPQLRREKPALIGVSIPTRMQIIPALMLSRELRNQGHFVVIGGSFFTKFIDRLLGMPEFFDYFADAIVIHEGETAIIELLNQLSGKKEFSKVPNLLFREGNQVRLTKFHLEDYTSLPVPDFDGLPLNHYLSPKLVLPVLLAKGCYWNKCKFCDSNTNNPISKKSFQARTPEKFAEDVVHLNRTFGCEHFIFADEAIPPRLLEKVADTFKASDIRGLHFAAYVRLEPGFTEKVCRKAAAMGMKRFFFGLESGCQSTLDHMAKGIKIENVLPILRNCIKSGIQFHLFSMIGLPEENEESALQTAAFFEKNRDLIDHFGNSFDIHLFELLLRTSYFKDASRMGVIIPKKMISGDFVVGVGTNWKNTRGLSGKRTQELLEEFGERFQKLYMHYDTWPPLIWPVLEEWALLYGVKHTKSPYPFRISLPEKSSQLLCRLRWNPYAQVKVNGSFVHITTRRASIDISKRFFDAIKNSTSESANKLLSNMARDCGISDFGEKIMLKKSIELLLQSNLLQLKCQSSENTKIS